MHTLGQGNLGQGSPFSFTEQHWQKPQHLCYVLLYHSSGVVLPMPRVCRLRVLIRFCIPVCTRVGTVLQVYKCNSAFKGGINEKFAFDPATGILSSSLYAEGQSCLTACAL